MSDKRRRDRVADAVADIVEAIIDALARIGRAD